MHHRSNTILAIMAGAILTSLCLQCRGDDDDKKKKTAQIEAIERAFGNEEPTWCYGAMMETEADELDGVMVFSVCSEDFERPEL